MTINASDSWKHRSQSFRQNFFRIAAIIISLILVPYAFSQASTIGIGMVAILTAGFSVWLGYHPNSPIAGKHNSTGTDSFVDAPKPDSTQTIGPVHDSFRKETIEP